MQVHSEFWNFFILKTNSADSVNGIHNRLNVVSLSSHSSGQFLIRIWPVLALFTLRWVHYGISYELRDSNTVRVWVIFDEFLEQVDTSQTH